MAEDYYSWTTYQYVRNNPIIRVDPNGMADTGYQVDDEDNITYLNEEGGDDYDVLYKKETYKEENRNSYDETGEKDGLNLSKGVIQSERKFTETSETDPPVTTHFYKSQSDSESSSLLKFLDKNTDVEWSNTLLKNKTNGQEMNLLMTSHQREKINRSYYIHSMGYFGKFVPVRHDHTQPDDSYAGRSDRGHAEAFLYFNKNAQFRILFNGQFYPYKIN